MGVSMAMGVPPVIIHFQVGFSLTKTNQLLGIPQFRKPSYVTIIFLSRKIYGEKTRDWSDIQWWDLYFQRLFGILIPSIFILFLHSWDRVFQNYPSRLDFWWMTVWVPYRIRLTLHFPSYPHKNTYSYVHTCMHTYIHIYIYIHTSVCFCYIHYNTIVGSMPYILHIFE